jgi:hypothetical protein
MRVRLMVTTKNNLEKLHGFYPSIDTARNAGLYLVKKNQVVKYRLAK